MVPGAGRLILPEEDQLVAQTEKAPSSIENGA